MDQVLETQNDSQLIHDNEKDRSNTFINKLNLDKVAIGANDTSSRTGSLRQLNAPRAGRLPTSSDCQADSVNYIRTDFSDSLEAVDIAKDDSITNGENDPLPIDTYQNGCISNRVCAPVI